MKKRIFVLVAIAIFISLSFGQAQQTSTCSYNGVDYPEGTIIGPYQCKDGKWVRP